MPCLLLLDRRSTPVSGSIIKVIFSFPERILYLKAEEEERACVAYGLQSYFAQEVLQITSVYLS